MNPEHYRVRIDGKRLVVAVASEQTLDRIARNLADVGALPVGPSAWLCDLALPIERLAATIGELVDGEVIYLSAVEADRGSFGFLAPPKTEGGIVITSEL